MSLPPLSRPQGFLQILILLGSVALALTRLDHTYFWDDEADVATVARTLIATGHLSNWDGRNLFAPCNGGSSDANFRTVGSPPLCYLIAAASFKLFGVSTWTGRFPFAFIGLLGLGLLPLLLREAICGPVRPVGPVEQFAEEPQLGPLYLYATALLGLSVIFLLNIRQCRYHAVSATLVTSTLWAYYKCLHTFSPAREPTMDSKARVAHKLLWFGVLAACAIAFFYSQMLLSAAFLLGLTLTHFVFHRRNLSSKDYLWFGAAACVFLAATMPYTLHYRLWVRPDLPTDPTTWYVRRPILLWWNLRDLNFQTSLPWTVAAALLWFIWVANRKSRAGVPPAPNGRLPAERDGRDSCPALVARMAVEWIVLVAAYIFFLSLISPSVVNNGAIHSDLRYLSAIIPVTACLVGIFLWTVHQGVLFTQHAIRNTQHVARFTFHTQRLVAFGALLILLITNLATLHFTNRELRWLLPAYLSELRNPYPTCYSEAAQFLRENARQDDVVFCTPHFTHCPLVFYVGDKVRFGCTLNLETTLPLEKVRSLPAPLLAEENFPDWVISFSADSSARQAMQFFSREHTENGRTVTYTYGLAKVLDVFWFDLSRPELTSHHFGPKTDFDRRTEAVYVFKRLPSSSSSKSS
ncbi:MAG: hypothetical protein C5B50_18595 [Verrucomicrobia bacterium]|nr:MAG: hypothetical protein C5B50_18595 [Verrucomicrobiota bacterium]